MLSASRGTMLPSIDHYTHNILSEPVSAPFPGEDAQLLGGYSLCACTMNRSGAGPM
jgi:hypothetical protein